MVSPFHFPRVVFRQILKPVLSGRIWFFPAALAGFLVAVTSGMNVAFPAESQGAVVSHFNGLTLMEGSRYEATLVYREEMKTWWPIEGVYIPMHHAVRLDWSRAEDLAAMPTDKPIRVVFTVEEKVVKKMPGRHQWRTEYFCKIFSMMPGRAPTQ